MPPSRAGNGRVALPAVVLAAVLAAIGCTQNPFRDALPQPAALAPPAAATLMPPALARSSVAPLPSYADVDGGQLEAALVRSREESQIMQDEIVALRDQLASTSAQLAQTRSATMPVAATAGDPAADPTAGRAETPAATMQSAMSDLSLVDLTPRFDGSVVRIDIPADRLFEEGTANLVPGGTALLTQVSKELDRVFPGHFVGIEGHADSEPLRNASWASPHQLTAARAAAVFDFLTTRTGMREAQLFLVAHGSNHPLVSNATAVGRARNRRVELVVYPERSGSSDD